MIQVPIVTAVIRDVASPRLVDAHLLGRPVRVDGKSVAVEVYVPAMGRHTLAKIEDVEAVNEEARVLLAYVPDGAKA